jgi:hypothetical protein
MSLAPVEYAQAAIDLIANWNSHEEFVPVAVRILDLYVEFNLTRPLSTAPLRRQSC